MITNDKRKQTERRRRLAKRLNYLNQDTGPGTDGMKMSVRISQGELIYVSDGWPAAGFSDTELG